MAWRSVTPARRARHLRALAGVLRSRHDELAALATAEMGKPITQARAEIKKTAAGCEFFAEHGPRWLADEHPPGAAANARVSFEPVGVVLAIMPWNFPFWQVFRSALPALMAGNAVLLKHAPSLPGCSRALESIFGDNGFPDGVFQALLTDASPVAGLIADPRVGAVTLTGSTAAGKSVATLAGAALKPGVFELGGSDPAIILEDADLDAAAETCAHARLMNSGQSCICTKRVIVVRSVRREFEKRFVARMAARRLGDPTDPTTEIGPLARSDLRDKLHAQVTASLSRGARVALGGTPVPGPGFFYPATVLTNVVPGMPAFDEELFGPVAAVVSARDEADAIRLANASIYGLGASIFTRNRARARRIVPQLSAGTIAVNDFVRSDASLPFGGTKQSGFGRELGVWGLRSFQRTKVVWNA